MSQLFRMRMGREEPPPSLAGKGAAAGPTGRGWSLSHALLASQAALAAGDDEQALEILVALRDRRPGHPHVLLHLARAQSACGDLETAIQTFYKAKEHTANSPVVDFFLGEAFLRHGRLAEAEEAVRRCLRFEKDDRLAGCLLGLCLFRQGRYRAAFEEWKKAGWAFNGELLIEATIVFERYLLEAPEAAPPELPASDAFAAGAAALDGGAPPRGLLAKIARRWRVKRLTRKAEGLLAAQNTAEAWKVIDKALAAAPGDANVLLLRAVALYELDCYQDAARTLLRVLRRDPSVAPQCFLAYCLLRLGAVEVAQEILSKVKPEGPYDYYMHYNLGLSHLIRGDLAEARRWFAVAYGAYFIDSREYCFEYLLHKVHAAVERAEGATARS